ncbi:hypothetical protein C8R34_10813 [Nitrosomonas sp. Nm84]|uniref:HIRAN domain-containing protein n=1 Tax=Nitrosomonas sp. Nm84 TaxID=200124 RepID=UPI000D773F8B|nr:HIRAN domain-containing protein [Nitrosomonas sp. Nm84]PXW88201.1 hypothetical protein C8R34_10813 [Nitrosomonas sp. Nm84]
MKKQPYSSPGQTHKQESKISVLSILILSLFLGLIAGAGVDKSHILPIAFVSAVVLLLNRNKIAAGENVTQSDGAQQDLSTAKDYYAWPELGQFAFTVAGEQYQEVIKQLIQENVTNSKAGSGSKAYILQTHLIPDNDNPYDSGAVRVDINNRTVGYLNREEARSFRRRLDERKLSNQITTCNAIIVGGEVNRKTLNYDVKLDIESLANFDDLNRC